MKGLIIYIVLVAIGAFIAFQIGVFVERNYSNSLSLVVFLGLFFLNFAVSWWITCLIMDKIEKKPVG